MNPGVTPRTFYGALGLVLFVAGLVASRGVLGPVADWLGPYATGFGAAVLTRCLLGWALPGNGELVQRPEDRPRRA
jgi:hypothetical protein